MFFIQFTLYLHFNKFSFWFLACYNAGVQASEKGDNVFFSDNHHYFRDRHFLISDCQVDTVVDWFTDPCLNIRLEIAIATFVLHNQ